MTSVVRWTTPVAAAASFVAVAGCFLVAFAVTAGSSPSRWSSALPAAVAVVASLLVVSVGAVVERVVASRLLAERRGGGLTASEVAFLLRCHGRRPAGGVSYGVAGWLAPRWRARRVLRSRLRRRLRRAGVGAAAQRMIARFGGRFDVPASALVGLFAGFDDREVAVFEELFAGSAPGRPSRVPWTADAASLAVLAGWARECTPAEFETLVGLRAGWDGRFGELLAVARAV